MIFRSPSPDVDIPEAPLTSFVLKRAAEGLVPPQILARKKQPYRAPDAQCFFGPQAPSWVADAVSEVDVAFDTVGGDVTESLVPAVRDGGVIVVIASAPPEEAAKARGYAYIAITDHSKALAMANGLDEARAVAFAQQVRERSGVGYREMGR